MGVKIAVDGRLGRLIRRTAGNPRMSAFTGRVMPVLDKAATRLTRGRWIPSSLIVPAMVLTTTGAKTGLQRESPLATLPADGGFYVVGSNFGGAKHPGWSANLLAHPRAQVLYDGRRVDVTARLLDEQQKADVWPRLRGIWPGYDEYVKRSGRDLRVFFLDPAAQVSE